MSKVDIVTDIIKELEYQKTIWGKEFDDKNTVNDWVTYIVHYASKAAMDSKTVDKQREAMVKTATLAISAVQAFDRNNEFADRHYENIVGMKQKNV